MHLKLACLLATAASALSATAVTAQTLEEVIVTAQKRDERLQDVPLSVTALSAERLDLTGATSSRDLMLVTPGLNFAQSSSTAQPQVRGVGTRAAGAGDESTVPIYIDGVYQSSQQVGFFDFNNIERIEVLKGPQGTLFGRNAVGGAINVITKTPSQDFEAQASASYGSFKKRVGDLYVSGPLTSTLSANIAVHANADGGYVKDLLDRNGNVARQSSFGGRGKLYWQPTDRFELTVGAWALESRDDTSSNGYPLNGSTIGLSVNPNIPIARKYQTATSFHPYFSLHTAGAYGAAKASFDGFDVSLLLSYTDTGLHLKADSDNSAADYAYVEYGQGDKAWTGEFRVTSSHEGPLQWIGGVFLFKDDACYGCGPALYTLRGSPTATTLALVANSESRAYAVFGEATYKLTDALSITGGLRYSSEDRDLQQYASTTPVAELPNLRTLIAYRPASAKFEKVSPRASIKYDFRENIHGYVTYSQGFKSGLFPATTLPPGGPTAAPAPVVRPEVLDSIEVGFKTEPTRAMRLNLSAYKYKYKDMQITSRDLSFGTRIQNATDATIYGGEAELEWALTSAWSVNAGAAYLHATFDKFPGASAFAPRNDRLGNTALVVDASGNTIPRSPKWTFNLASDYTLPLAGGELVLSGNYFWMDNLYWDVNETFDNGGSHQQLNLKAAWTSPQENFRISVYGENLTDDDRPNLRQVSAATTYEANQRPRAFGVRFDYYWK